MALTTAQLAVALRIIGAETEDVPAGVTSILTRQSAVARALVDVQAPTAPEDVKDEATVRLTGFLYDQSPQLPRASNPMVASGAAAVLRPWHVATLLFPTAAAAGGGGAGVNTAAVEALIATAIAAVRQLPDEGADGQFLGHAEGAPAWVPAPAGGGGGGLTMAERETLDGAVQIESVDLVGNTLSMTDSGDTSKSFVLRQVPTIENADANKVLTVDNGGSTADWEDPAGLSQSQVDGRVTALRPVAVPALPAEIVSPPFARLLAVNNGGSTLYWQTPTDLQNQVVAQVNTSVPETRRVPSGGANGQFLGHAAGKPAWVPAPSGGTATPSGNTLPSSPSAGDRFNLLMEQANVSYPATITAGSTGGAQGQFGWFGTIGHIDLDGNGVIGVLWYGTASGNPAALRGRIAVWRAAGEGRNPTSIFIGGSTHTLSAAPGLNHVWRTGLNANPFTAGSGVNVQVFFGSDENWPNRTYEPREYRWDGFHWIAWAALTGADIRDELQTLAGANRLSASAIRGLPVQRFERLLFSGVGSGLTISNVGQGGTTAAATIGTPAFDLDDEGQGELDVEAVIHVGTRGVLNLGYTTDLLQTYRVTDIVFASSLADLDTFDSSTPEENTIVVGDPLDVYVGSVKVGEIAVRLGKNAAGQLLYIVRYSPDSQSSTSTNFSIGLGLSVAFSPTDASSAEDSGGGGVALTELGTLYSSSGGLGTAWVTIPLATIPSPTTGLQMAAVFVAQPGVARSSFEYRSGFYVLQSGVAGSIAVNGNNVVDFRVGGDNLEVQVKARVALTGFFGFRLWSVS